MAYSPTLALFPSATAGPSSAHVDAVQPARPDFGTPPHAPFHCARRGSNASLGSSHRVKRPGSSGRESSFMTSGSFELPQEQEACAVAGVVAFELDEGPAAPAACSSPAGIGLAGHSLSTPPHSRESRQHSAGCVGGHHPHHQPHQGALSWFPSAINPSAVATMAADEGDGWAVIGPSTPHAANTAHYAGRRGLAGAVTLPSAGAAPARGSTSCSRTSQETPLAEPDEPFPAAPAVASAPVAGMLMAPSGVSSAADGGAPLSSRNHRREHDIDFATAYREAILAHRAQRAPGSPPQSR